ncbi:MAG: amidohydrolase family protein [Bacteroidia bacterium]
MPLITADFIYSPTRLLTGYCLETDHRGTILDIRLIHPQDRPQVLKGLLCPGFINAHCHLELSAMKGMIPEGTGMAGFIRQLMGSRNHISYEMQAAAVKSAMDFLWEKGTAGMGDICNSNVSMVAKRDSLLFTYSFIEMLGLAAARAAEIVENGKALAAQFEGLAHSLSPHAPYSMSRLLLQEIYRQKPERMSIHLLESAEERMLFEENAGPILEFYRQMGIPYSGFDTDDPVTHIFTGLDRDQHLLLVHNTRMKAAELSFISENYPNAWFCLCPASNLYIHSTLPDLHMFRKYTEKICLGTDSYASNHSIDVFEEVKLIQEKYPEISLHEVLRWATTQGAAALGAEDFLGAFTPGTRPGINHIEAVDTKQIRLLEGAVVNKLY